MGQRFGKQVLQHSASLHRKLSTVLLGTGEKPQEDVDECYYLRFHPESLVELERTTHFSQAELKLLYRCFKENCATGYITCEQLKEIFERFFLYGSVSEYTCLVFKTFDLDGNGRISFVEFVVALSILLRGGINEKLSWIFNLYDHQNRGFITKQDMLGVMRSIYLLTGQYPIYNEVLMQHVQFMFMKLDENNDGKITHSEFVDGCSRDVELCRSLHLFGSFWEEPKHHRRETFQK